MAADIRRCACGAPLFYSGKGRYRLTCGNTACSQARNQKRKTGELVTATGFCDGCGERHGPFKLEKLYGGVSVRWCRKCQKMEEHEQAEVG